MRKYMINNRNNTDEQCRYSVASHDVALLAEVDTSAPVHILHGMPKDIEPFCQPHEVTCSRLSSERGLMCS